MKIVYGPVNPTYEWHCTICIETSIGWRLESSNYPINHTLTASGSSTIIDNLSFELWGPPGALKFEFYEYGSLTPTKTKIVEWNNLQ